MLKYQLDENKLKTFLNFWNLKELEDFEELEKDQDSVYFKIYTLGDEYKKTIAEILTQYQKEEKITYKNNKIVITKTSSVSTQHVSAPELLEYLDDINILSLKRDRSNLSAGSDLITFTKFFIKFLSNTIFLPNIINDPLEDIDTSTLTPTELEAFLEIKLSFYFHNIITQKNYKSLIKKTNIISGFDNKFQLTLFTNSALKEEEKQLTSIEQSAIITGINEVTSWFIYRYEFCLYSRYFKNKRDKQRLENCPPILLDGIDHLNTLLRKKKNINMYRKWGFIKRYRFILSRLSERLQLILKIIYKNKANNITNVNLLIRELNKILIEKDLKNHSVEVFRAIFNGFQYIGLAKIKDGHIVFNFDFIDEVLAPKGQKIKKPVTDSLIIDSDFQISFYRQQTSANVFYYLRLLCTIENAEHLCQAKIKEDQADFAFFAGFDYTKASLFLRKFAREYFTSVFLEHLKYIYNQTKNLTWAIRYSISTGSQPEYNKLKYVCKSLKRQISYTFQHKRKEVILEDKTSFDILAAELKKKKMPLL